MRSAAGIVATLAAVLASAGDLLLLGVANGIAPALAAGGYLRPAALIAGYYLGVLAIPFYAVGYWHLGCRLPRPYGRVVTMLGACGAVVGATIHGVTSTAIATLQAPSSGGGVDALRPVAAYLVPLWTIVALATLVGSAAFTLPVLRGESTYPRWLAFANPVVGIAAISACAAVSPAVAPLLVPASPNVAHVLFFALASFLSHERSSW
jgi:hypothetical protein